MRLNYRSLAVALALVLIFCVSLAVMWPRREAAAPPALADTAEPVAVPAAAPPPPVSPVPASQDAQPVEPPAAVATSVPAPMAPANTEGPELPVILSISTHSRYVVEDGPQGEPVNGVKDVTEGILVNTSDQPLDLSVIEVDFQTHAVSQAQILLGKNMQKHFGIDQGLTMKPGDDITLRSPSYRDLTQQIP